MIDISDKEELKRKATAQGVIHLQEKTISTIKRGKVKKGAVLETAKIVAITAVKQTTQTLPFCHNIPIEKVKVSFEIFKNKILVSVKVKTKAKTGVEMEAIMGAQAALGHIWDMVKYLEKDETGNYPHARITDIIVTEKIKGEAEC